MLAALPALAQSEDEGASLYGENCQSCHQPGGSGLEGAFPPLAGNPNVTDSAHVQDVIRNGLTGPIEVNGVTYDGVMPAFPQLSDSQIDSLVMYLQGLDAAPIDGPTTTTVPAGPVAGDSGNGELIFTGAVQLAEGGPACQGCHVAGPVTGGGTLGPDLTDVLSRLGGAAGVSGWLANPASPTMQPIYAAAPLTESEITDLTAFLAEIQGTTPPPSTDWFLIGGVAGLALLLGLVAVTSRGGRMTYADRLRSRS